MKNILKQAAMSILLVALVCSFCITPAMAATEFIGETKENSAVVSDESAELAASSGWVKKSSGRFEYYSKAGKVTKKLVKKNGFFRYYLKKNGKWKAQKKVWVTISHNQYYANAKGKVTTIYYGASKKAKRYSGGKWKYVKNDTLRLANGNVYYFSANGIRQTKHSWYKINDNRHVLVGEKGSDTVDYLLKKDHGAWKCYVSTKKGWDKFRSKWAQAYGKIYYFDATGKASRIYYVESMKCYEYKNGKYVMWRNTTRYIGKYLLYFGSDGVRVTKSGWYKISSDKEIYVNSQGIVTDSRTPVKETTGHSATGWYTIKLSNGSTKQVYGYFDYDAENAIIRQLNAYRKANGLNELKRSQSLMDSARVRAYECSYSFSHTRPDGTQCFTASSEMNGENIAAGYPSADAAMTAWKNSPGHDANMKFSLFSKIGVGVFVAVSSDNCGYKYYYVQNFGI